MKIVYVKDASESDGQDCAWVDNVVWTPKVYVVEFNALWFNALKFTAALLAENGDAVNAEAYEGLAQQCGSAFGRVFLNEHGYLFDYVDEGEAADYSVRPNMIFAVSLPYSPLTAKQQKSVLDMVTRELLTPRGLRSLSPKSFGYNPIYQGVQTERDYAYHQGTAWPWLGCFYLEAVLRLYKKSRLSFIQRQMAGYEDDMTLNCVTTIPELADGNPPFRARGAVSFAMNVAEILRTISIIGKYTYNK